MKHYEFTIYSHWLGPLIGGDYTVFDYYDDPEDEAEFDHFAQSVPDQFGRGHFTYDSSEPCFGRPSVGDRRLPGNVVDVVYVAME